MTRSRTLATLAIFALGACAPRPSLHPPLQVSTAHDTLTPYGRAVARGTRSWRGAPGPRYWQQYARYRIEATLEPGKARLSAREWVTYYNHSPDTLRTLALHLYQNIHAYGAARTQPMPLTGGLTLAHVAAGELELHEVSADGAAGYRVDGTIAWLALPRALPPGDSARLELAWSFKVPPKGGPRMGQDGVVFFLGQWYPQLAVYDDISGWEADQYMGTGEFYSGFADFDVRITAPEGWLVPATGTLENAREVLTPAVRERLDAARRTSGVTHVVAHARGAGKSTARGADGKLTWHYTARRVRDFAFGASNGYVWDATAATIPDRDGDGAPDTVLVNTLYRPHRGIWKESTRYLKHSVEFLSRYLWPYPYDAMTAVEGLVDGGMEYPMLTLIGGDLTPDELYRVTVHETGHMWFPMQVSSDETRYGWQDEGLTSYDEAQGVHDFLHQDDEKKQQREYLAYVGRGWETPLVHHADEYPNLAAYQIASYDKPTAVLRALRGVLGDSVFLAAYREYGRRWQWKHPQPEDLWNTFEDVSGRDLSWFWRSWFLETWPLDQAIGTVRQERDSLTVTIENRGRAIMPVPLRITRADHGIERQTLPASIWDHGVRSYTIHLADIPRIEKIEIDPEEMFPDTHRGNNTWRR